MIVRSLTLRWKNTHKRNFRLGGPLRQLETQWRTPCPFITSSFPTIVPGRENQNWTPSMSQVLLGVKVPYPTVHRLTAGRKSKRYPSSNLTSRLFVALKGITLSPTDSRHPPSPGETVYNGNSTVVNEGIRLKTVFIGLLTSNFVGDAGPLCYWKRLNKE